MAKVKVVPLSKTAASQKGSLGSKPKKVSVTTRKKPPSNISSVRGGK